MQRRRKSLSEQITFKEEQIEKCKAVIISSQEKLNIYINELEALRSLEVMTIINEINIPYCEVKEILLAKKAARIDNGGASH